MTDRVRISRRRVLGALGVLGAAAVGGRLPAPPPAAAVQPVGVHESVQEALRRLFGDRPIRDGTGVVRLDLPAIAENGALVPVTVEVTSPMTASQHVKHIWVIADRNRIPVVTRATLTPEAGQALIGATIRLGETGDVRAIVERSDGTLLQVKREVKVTISGCGG
jgi:sulfur-oxidizing protein SoxY